MKYKPGDICWLKQKEHCIDIDLFPLPDGCYNHPVVVIWEEEEHEAAAVLVITSFNNTTLELKHARNLAARRLHIPIHPSAPNPYIDNIVLKTKGKKLAKNSYVKIENVRRCSINSLRSYDSRRLAPKSFKSLMKHVSDGTKTLTTTQSGASASVPTPIYESHLGPMPILKVSSHTAGYELAQARIMQPVTSKAQSSSRTPQSQYQTNIQCPSSRVNPPQTHNPNSKPTTRYTPLYTNHRQTYGSTEPRAARNHYVRPIHFERTRPWYITAFYNPKLHRILWILIYILTSFATLYLLGVGINAFWSWLKNLGSASRDLVCGVVRELVASVQSWFGAKVDKVVGFVSWGW